MENELLVDNLKSLGNADKFFQEIPFLCFLTTFCVRDNSHCLQSHLGPVLVISVQTQLLNEPPHDKTHRMTVRPAKTQINLGIRPV